MSLEFDPYYKWFGIPPKDQPPHHYRLLGIELFESDKEVIDAAANRQMTYLQEIVDGDNVELSQRLLNEISAARVCLLSPQTKAAYDRQLKAKSKPTASTAKAQNHSKQRSVVKQPPTQTSVAARFQDRRRSHQVKPRWIIAGTVGAVMAVAITTLSIAVFTSSNDDPVANRDHSSESAAEPTRQAVQDVAPTDGLNAVDNSQKNTAAPEVTSVAAAERVSHKPIIESGAFSSSSVSQEIADPGEDPSSTTKVSIQAKIASNPPSNQTADTNAGLVLWLDAAAEDAIELIDQNQVVRWNDQSGNGYRAGESSFGELPKFVRGEGSNLAVVQFSGGQSLQLTDSERFNFGESYSIVFVARGTQGILMAKGLGYQGKGFSFWKSVDRFRTNNKYLTADDSRSDEFNVRTIVADEQSFRWYVGEGATQVHEQPHVIDNDGALILGCRDKADSPNFFVGDLAELLIYDRAINDLERETLLKYLQNKWLAKPEQLAFASNTSTESEIGATSAAVATTTSIVDKTDQPRPEHAHQFVTLAPTEAIASQETKLELLDDGRIVASGATKRAEEYDIKFTPTFSRVTAFRIEALPHESLPADGPGRGPLGRFSIEEIECSYLVGDHYTKITFAQALSNASGKVEQIIDGEKSSSWGIRRGGEPTIVTLILEEPLELPKDSTVSLTLHNHENIGCFRLLATSAEKPGELPVNVENRPDGFALHANLGGSEFKDDNGVTWSASKTYDDKTWGHEKGSKVTNKGEPNPLTSSAVRGIRAFRAIVPNGQYEVYLLFCEHWTSTPEGRMFTIFVEGQRAGTLDLLKDAGGRGKPLEVPIRTVAVEDGRLDIAFEPLTDKASAILNAITIRQK